eukprot:9052995-Pyramimonas_sp.AAC.1
MSERAEVPQRRPRQRRTARTSGSPAPRTSGGRLTASGPPSRGGSRRWWGRSAGRTAAAATAAARAPG